MAVIKLASAPRRTSLYDLSLRMACTKSSHSSWYGSGSGGGKAQTMLSLVSALPGSRLEADYATQNRAICH